MVAFLLGVFTESYIRNTCLCPPRLGVAFGNKNRHGGPLGYDQPFIVTNAAH